MKEQLAAWSPLRWWPTSRPSSWWPLVADGEPEWTRRLLLFNGVEAIASRAWTAYSARMSDRGAQSIPRSRRRRHGKAEARGFAQGRA